MSFQNYLCWKPEEVHSIIKPDAEALEDELFLAVHTNTAINVKKPSPRLIDPNEFIGQFLEESHKHYQVAVIGQSGTGKSHFIQWVRTHIPKVENTHVLTIKKAGTSLRNIIRQIITTLPETDQKLYLDEWGKIGHTVSTVEEQRIRLLNNIATSIEIEVLNDDVSEEEELVHELLPSLFYDPFYRKQYFLKDGAIISELSEHIFSEQGKYNPSEDRRLFSAKDIPVSGGDFQKAAHETQQLISELQQSGEVVDLAINIINRNLDNAISETLSFSTDAMINLMNSLRKFLYSNGKTLILLIEDFARLQGVDTALLQALTIPSDQGDEKLCKLKWVMAVTTGYYNKLADTVRTRMDQIIEMDTPWKGVGENESNDLVQFTAKYMNAVRLGYGEVSNWFDSRQVDDENIVSACERCTHTESCHNAFGKSDGYGIYPFNVTALNKMDISHRDESGEFNPRYFLKSVLIPVLNQYADALASGVFPPASLLSVSQYSIPPVKRQELRQLDSVNFERRMVFAELWCGGQIKNLAPAIHDVFSLKRLPTLDSGDTESLETGKETNAENETKNVVDDPTPKKVKKQKKVTEVDEERVLNPKIKAIHDWVGGKSLPENLVNDLRGIVFELVASHISWDENGLSRTYFASPQGKPFRQRSINFRNQSTQMTKSAVELTLPVEDGDDDLMQTALALEAMLLYQEHGDWSFEKSEDFLASLLNCLERWSTLVLDQITALKNECDSWDLKGNVAKLLLFGGVLSGVAISDQQEHLIDAALSAWPEKEFLNKKLSTLYRDLKKLQNELVDYYRSTSSGPKGGSLKAGILKPTLLIENSSFDDLQKWLGHSELPNCEQTSELSKSLVKFLKKFNPDILAALDDELFERGEFFKGLQDDLGDLDCDGYIFSANQFYQLILQSGVSCNGNENKLQSAISTITIEDLDTILNCHKGLSGKDKLLNKIINCSKCNKGLIEKYIQLKTALDNCYSSVDSHLDLIEDETSGSGQGIKETIAKIHQSLSEIETVFDKLSE